MTLPLQKFEPTKFLHNYFCKVAPIPLASIALQIVAIELFSSSYGIAHHQLNYPISNNQRMKVLVANFIFLRKKKNDTIVPLATLKEILNLPKKLFVEMKISNFIII